MAPRLFEEIDAAMRAPGAPDLGHATGGNSGGEQARCPGCGVYLTYQQRQTHVDESGFLCDPAARHG